MAKQLDTPNNEQQSILDEPVVTAEVLEDEIDDVDEFDLEDSMDEDGNIFEDDEEVIDEEEDVDDSEEELDTDDEDLEESDEDEEPEEELPEPTPKRKAKKKLSPADIKVINLKKEKQKLEQEKAELQRKLQEKNQAKETENLQAQFVAQGYDEDTAKNMAANEIRIKQIELRQAVLDFRDANEDTFDKYPEAKKNVADIMQKSKASGLTAEQICMALYGQAKVNPREERASRAARGEATRVTTEDSVSRASRTGTRQEEVSLTSAQRREKRILEQTFNNGKQMTNAEYLRYSRR